MISSVTNIVWIKETPKGHQPLEVLKKPLIGLPKASFLNCLEIKMRPQAYQIPKSPKYVLYNSDRDCILSLKKIHKEDT